MQKKKPTFKAASQGSKTIYLITLTIEAVIKELRSHLALSQE